MTGAVGGGWVVTASDGSRHSGLRLGQIAKKRDTK